MARLRAMLHLFRTSNRSSHNLDKCAPTAPRKDFQQPAILPNLHSRRPALVHLCRGCIVRSPVHHHLRLPKKESNTLLSIRLRADLLALLVLLLGTVAQSAEPGPRSNAGSTDDAGVLAKRLQNPNGDLLSVPEQHQLQRRAEQGHTKDRIASLDLLPSADLLPQLICSPPVCIGGGGHGADQYGGTGRACGCVDGT